MGLPRGPFACGSISLGQKGQRHVAALHTLLTADRVSSGHHAASRACGVSRAVWNRRFGSLLAGLLHEDEGTSVPRTATTAASDSAAHLGRRDHQVHRHQRVGGRARVRERHLVAQQAPRENDLQRGRPFRPLALLGDAVRRQEGGQAHRTAAAHTPEANREGPPPSRSQLWCSKAPTAARCQCRHTAETAPTRLARAPPCELPLTRQSYGAPQIATGLRGSSQHPRVAHDTKCPVRHTTRRRARAQDAPRRQGQARACAPGAEAQATAARVSRCALPAETRLAVCHRRWTAGWAVEQVARRASGTLPRARRALSVAARSARTLEGASLSERGHRTPPPRHHAPPLVPPLPHPWRPHGCSASSCRAVRSAEHGCCCGRLVPRTAGQYQRGLRAEAAAGDVE